jgi:hypothetical protein
MTEWLETPITEETAARVRGGVLTRIRRRRQTRRVGGAAAVLAALALAFWPAPAPLETLTLDAPPPPAAPAWKPIPTKPPVFTAQAPSRPAERITIYTSDPDVVIVLVADGGEE